MIHPHALGKSFRYAARGIALVWATEQNFRIQSVIGIAVFGFALWLRLPTWKMVALLFVVVSVLVLEFVNSIFERLVDAFAPRLHSSVAEMKDIMAAAVLLASVGSVVVGIILFWPHLAPLIR